MAVIDRNAAIALGAALLWSVALPVVLLQPPSAGEPGRVPPPAAPIAAPPAPPIAAAFQRPLFAPAGSGPVRDATGAPELIGIVGRLSADAVAMVRTLDGTTRTLKVGEGVDGWRLAALAPDAAFFTRGAQRVRVAVATGEAPPESTDPETDQ